MSSIAVNPLFQSLYDKEKEFINHSIDFLYSQNHSEAVNVETQKIIDDALLGKGIAGSYDTVEDLVTAIKKF